MSWWQAMLLGIVQGLTEFLPVSSSGHLTIGQTLLGVTFQEGDMLLFDILVHAATVCSTLLVLRQETWWLLRGTFGTRRWNEEKVYVGKILLSMLPVMFVGLFFKEKLDRLFGSGLLVVGICLMVTAFLLCFAHFYRPRQKEHIGWLDAIVIGLAQAIAVLPGLSRSGTTIATGLVLGNKREQIARFSFLMVLIPVLGMAFLDMLDVVRGDVQTGLSVAVMAVGFVSACAAGCAACRWMIALVKRQKLVWFAIYCCLLGLFAIVYHYVV